MANTTQATAVHLPVSDMAENLIGSEIIKLAAEINEKIRNGERIFNYTIGDFDPKIFPIPSELNDEIIRAYEQHHTNYPAANGMPELRKTVAEFLRDYEGLNYTADEVLISGGLLLGVGEKLSEVFIGPLVGGGIEIWFGYVLVLFVLLVRPQGLFGEKIIDRV